MERDAFLKAIWEDPNDDTTRLIFADWLEDRAESCAAARLRWWCRVRVRLWQDIRLDAMGNLSALGDSIARADGWRWRLGCLVAIRRAECEFLPHFDPAPWPAGWSAQRFLTVLHRCRCLIEAVALGILAPAELTEARQLADQPCEAGRGLVDASCPTGFDVPLGPWLHACEVLHMAERSLAIAQALARLGARTEG